MLSTSSNREAARNKLSTCRSRSTRFRVELTHDVRSRDRAGRRPRAAAIIETHPWPIRLALLRDHHLFAAAHRDAVGAFRSIVVRGVFDAETGTGSQARDAEPGAALRILPSGISRSFANTVGEAVFLRADEQFVGGRLPCRQNLSSSSPVPYLLQETTA